MDELAVIDRFVDDTYAVLLVGDDETERIVPVTDLPEDAGPGVWLRVRFEGDNLVEVAVEASVTEQARARIAEKMDRLRARGRRND